MSGFDPSVLERKDRDELSQIAESLGQKPPSRARKADIVDLILRLAGVGADAGAGSGDGGPADEEPAAQPAPKPASKPAARNGAAAPAPQPSDEGEADDADDADDTDEADGPTDRRNDEPARDEPAHDEPDTHNQRPEARSGDGNRDQDANRSQDANRNQDGGRGGDDAEPGNRRRRRRGRGGDRDRSSQEETNQSEPIDVDGLLDLRDEGYGFLRLHGYLPSKDDVYVSVKQVRQFGLRKGDHLSGKSRAASRNEKNPALLQIDTINGAAPDEAKPRPRFEDLTPLFPDSRLNLELADDPNNMTARIVDLVAPIGKGQRGLIVSPPKAGKTTVMKQIARSIEVNNPEAKLIVLLVDERPEEVTDMRRWLLKGEVAASTFDRPSEEHTHVAELVLERAKRMVEEGQDVVIILDGITRLARAYNLSAPATGRIMSGGIDTGALYPPKKFFGAARNVEEGGSLTILATALVETGSRMDEVIFEEFKGTGNMELKLDRRMADRRIYPAIDVEASSTRHEELLFERKQLQQVWKLRRVLSGLKGDEGGSNAAGLELLIDRMKSFKSNDAFLTEIAKAQTPA
ncbi:MAG: transcription termination factor Rho [Acidimicrobiia bacterium]|nr:transcription termination factor Rho [Acidimicrobiia bacterium]